MRRSFVGIGHALGHALGSATIVVCWAACSSSQPAAGFLETKIPFDFVLRHIVLPVTVGGSRPLSFILDTGDKFTVIDFERAKELGLPVAGQVGVQGVGAQSSTGAWVQNTTFSIAGVTGLSQPVTLAFPLRNLAPRLGQDCDGIIGADFIRQFVVEIDYQARVITLHDKAKFVYSGPGESIPAHLNAHGHPVVAAQVTPIGGTPIQGNFEVDIGASGALALYTPFVEKNQLLGPSLKTVKQIGSAGTGGVATGRIGRVAELAIGKFKLAEPTTAFSSDKEGNFASAEIEGNIGARITSKFKLFLDYGHDRIIFEPNATLAEPFDAASAGVAMVAEGEDYRTFRITEILEDCPASEAGLQPNDVIQAIDGRAAADLTLSTIADLFEHAVPYKVTIRRGTQVLNVTLTPRKLV